MLFCCAGDHNSWWQVHFLGPANSLYCNSVIVWVATCVVLCVNCIAVCIVYFYIFLLLIIYIATVYLIFFAMFLYKVALARVSDPYNTHAQWMLALQARRCTHMCIGTRAARASASVWRNAAVQGSVISRDHYSYSTSIGMLYISIIRVNLERL